MSNEDYPTEETRQDVWQYRLAFDGVGNAGKWSRTFYDFDSAETSAQYAYQELVDLYGLLSAIQYRRGTRTITTEWKEA